MQRKINPFLEAKLDDSERWFVSIHVTLMFIVSILILGNIRCTFEESSKEVSLFS